VSDAGLQRDERVVDDQNARLEADAAHDAANHGFVGRAIDTRDAQTNSRGNDAGTLERLFHDRMKDLFERKLSRALEVRAFFARFSNDAFVVVCELAHSLATADVDAKDRHYRYITVHDRPVRR